MAKKKFSKGDTVKFTYYGMLIKTFIVGGATFYGNTFEYGMLVRKSLPFNERREYFGRRSHQLKSTKMVLLEKINKDYSVFGGDDELE